MLGGRSSLRGCDMARHLLSPEHVQGSEGHDAEAPDIHHQLCQRLSALCSKVEKKGRTKGEVDAVIRWLTGYDQADLDTLLEGDRDF